MSATEIAGLLRENYACVTFWPSFLSGYPIVVFDGW